MSQAGAITAESKCPYQSAVAADGFAIDERKTAVMADSSEARVKKLANGGIRIESFALTRKILRSGGMQQAGFMAELVLAATGRRGSTPALLKEGDSPQKG